MKKLIVLSIIGLAASVNAASLKWSVAKVYDQAEPTKYADGYAAYLFCTVDGSGQLPVTTMAVVEAAIKNGTFKSLLSGEKAVVADSGKLAGAQNTTFTVAGVDYTGTTANPTYVDGFAIIFNEDSYDNATEYLITAVKEAKFTSSTGGKTLTFGDQSSNTWQSIPEPTSGLLLLLGVAGLALKRKRA